MKTMLKTACLSDTKEAGVQEVPGLTDKLWNLTVAKISGNGPSLGKNKAETENPSARLSWRTFTAPLPAASLMQASTP